MKNPNPAPSILPLPRADDNLVEAGHVGGSTLDRVRRTNLVEVLHAGRGPGANLGREPTSMSDMSAVVHHELVASCYGPHDRTVNLWQPQSDVH